MLIKFQCTLSFLTYRVGIPITENVFASLALLTQSPKVISSNINLSNTISYYEYELLHINCVIQKKNSLRISSQNTPSFPSLEIHFTLQIPG